jgi:ribosomal-protein-alanine N-acetyltransferase
MLVLPAIRLATTGDAATIAQMSRDCIEQGLEWSWRQPRVRGAILDAATNVAVLAEGDSLLGFGIMQYRDDTAHLSLFAIRPSHRHRGLGGRLLAWLEQPALVAGIALLRVEARADNAGAIAFYRRHGFEPVRTVTGYYAGAIDAVKLEKRLGPPA